MLEQRHVIGGAAVTEELTPGFKFSRASYLLSLFRPIILKDLSIISFQVTIINLKSSLFILYFKFEFRFNEAWATKILLKKPVNRDF